MSVEGFFSKNFHAARDLFVDTCHRAGLDVVTHEHPLTGPDGEALAADSVLIGRADAPRLMVLVSGTHGVEALCGSACQSGFVAQGDWRDYGDDIAVLLIHALNCWGAAHLRRNNEDNVDLNRNFVDFAQALPENPAYEAVHDALACSEYRGPERDRANDALAAYLRDNGIEQYIAAIMGGQYRYPDGMAFGGAEPTWSNRLLEALLTPYAATARKVSIVEYHSGLGPYGYGSAVTMQTDEALERVRASYGRWVQAPNERAGPDDEQYFRAHGHTTNGFFGALPDAELSAIVLEYGTYPPTESLPVLIDDHWLHTRGDPASPEGRRIKERLLEMHYPDDEDWRQAVWDRSELVVRQTLRSLS